MHHSVAALFNRCNEVCSSLDSARLVGWLKLWGSCLGVGGACPDGFCSKKPMGRVGLLLAAAQVSNSSKVMQPSLSGGAVRRRRRSLVRLSSLVRYPLRSYVIMAVSVLF